MGRLALSLWMLVLCAGSVQAMTYSVRPGDDVQAVLDTLRPGDVLTVQDGIYQATDQSKREFWTVSTSGTSQHPITIQAAAGATPILRGFGFDDSDDGSGKARGPTGTSNQKMLWITGSYIHVRGLTLTNSTRYGVHVAGNHNRLEDMHIHANWEIGLYVTGSHNYAKHINTHHNRHGSGWHVDAPGANNTVARVLTWRNGFHEDRTRVLPYAGDPAGGGNSSGGRIGKSCDKGNANVCPGNIVQFNVALWNADGGLFTNASHALWLGNIIAQNGSVAADGKVVGGVGVKDLGRSAQTHFTVVQNLVCESITRGYEGRSPDSVVLNNTFVQNRSNGAYSGANASLEFANNLALEHSSGDFHNSISGARTKQTNWAKDGTGQARYQGDPHVVNPGFCAMFDEDDVPRGLSIAETVAWIRGQFRDAYALKPSSGAIDVGTPVSYVNPQTGDRVAIPFTGTAPDVGWGELIEGTTPPPIPSVKPPAAPTDFTLFARGTSDDLNLIVARGRWKAPTTDVDGNPVEPITSYTVCIDAQPIPDNKGSAQCKAESATQTDLLECPVGNVCYWRVSAHTAGGEGPLSAPRSITIPEDYSISR